MWNWSSLEAFWQDLRFGLRMLVKSPGFSAVTALSLVLGIGANTAVFSVIQAVLLRPLPYADPARLVLLTDPKDPDDGGILYRDFEAWKPQTRSFQDMAVYYRNSGWSQAALTGGEPQTVQGAFVSANFFSVMGVSPILGRPFTREEETRRERVVLLSHGLWMRRFGSSPDVVGQAIEIDGARARIIGVMPETFQFPGADSSFWAPITTNPHWDDPALLANDPNRSRGFYARWQAIARLRPGFTPRAAQAEMDTIAQHIENAAQQMHAASTVAVVPLQVKVRGNVRLVLTVLLAAVSLVLLIACANVCTLVLARGATRQRELAVRRAMGAGRLRIVRQLFTESILLAFLASCAGTLLAPGATRLLIALAPAGIPRLEETHLDAKVLLFTLAIAIVSAILFGLIPAWKHSRSDLMDPLKAGGRGMAGRSQTRRIQNALTIGEFALAVVLLAGAGLLLRSLLLVKAVDPGFRPEHVLTAHISLPANSQAARGEILDERTLARIRAIPGVLAVGAIHELFSSSDIKDFGLRSIRGRAPEAASQWRPLGWTTVRGDYFQAMGTRLLRGRFFTASDTATSPLVAIVNQTVARRYWPGENAVGKQFKGFDKRRSNDEWLTIVGVVEDMRTNGLDRQPAGQIYQWYRQSNDATPDLVVRTSSDPAALGRAVRNSVHAIDSTAIVSSVATMEQDLEKQLSPRRFETWLLSLFSVIALALASVGIYGVIHYGVNQRTSEIGLRMAVGAVPRDIQRLVLADGLLLGAIGLGLGIAGALGTARLLSSLLYGVSPSDPLTFCCVSLLLLTIVLIASFFPARRAARLDPLVALREE